MKAKTYCSVINCHQNEKNSVLHVFPKPNTPRFIEWLKATGNKRLLNVCPKKMHKRHYICRKHFAPQFLMHNNRVSIVSVPTLFLPEPIEVPNISERPSESLESMISDPTASLSRLDLDETVLEMDQTSSAVLQRVAVPTLCLPDPIEVPNITEEQTTKGPLQSLESMFSDPAAGPSRLDLDEMDQTSSGVLQQVAVPTSCLPEPIELPNITEEPTTNGQLQSLESMFSDPVADPSRLDLDELDQTSSGLLQQVAVPTSCLPEIQDVPKISEKSRKRLLESLGEVAGELGQSPPLLQPQLTGRQLFEAEQFDKICRLCFSNLEIKSFFKLHFEGLLLFEIYQEITLLQITQEDDLPKHICMTCIEKIVDTFIFIKSCQDSDKLLRYKIENRKIKMESVIKEEEELDIWQFDIPPDQLIESQGNVNSPVIQDVQSTEQQSSDIVVNQNPELLKLENKTDQSKIKFSKIHRFVERLPKLTGPPFTCNICSESFDTLSQIKYHYKRSSKCQPLIYPCPICNKRCVSRNKVQLHMRSHTKERPYKCNICNEKFRYQQNFIRHKKRHTEEKPYACDICEKTFTRSTTKIYHMRRHAGELPFLCTHCGKAFATSRGLQLHTINHKRENGEQMKPIQKLPKKFLCCKCPKKYVTRRLLFVHEQSDHTLLKTNQPNNFICSVCGKTYATKTRLNLHATVHSKIKSHFCKLCNKAFSYKTNLKNHLLIHTGERPHSCSICNMTFVQKIHLSEHIKTHTGEKPYICNFCGKCFALKSNLTVHIRQHTGETPYYCSVCNRGFQDSSSRKKHENTHREVKQWP